MDQNLRNLLFEDPVVLESFVEMRTAQPPKDRIHYFDAVLEGTQESNADLIQKLYTDIISKSNIDFGSIPDSKGNLVRYKEYPLMQQSMDRINLLFKGKASDELKLMNQVHDMIVNCKKDYEIGFTYDIEMIKITYNISVLTLYELINVCILSYTKQMRENAGIKFDLGKVKKSDNIVLKNAQSLLRSYQSGQWAKIITQVKKDRSILQVNIPATEAGAAVAASSFGTMFKAAASFAAGHIPLMIVVALIGIFLGVRKLIYFFYSGSAKVKDYVDVQKEFVNATMNSEKLENVDEKVINKRSKLLDKLDHITRFIEGKIFRTNQKAKEELTKSNIENFHKPSFGEAPAPGGFGNAGSISF